MKLVSVLLLALVTALVACSDKGGGGDVVKKPDFDPMRKPANAVSNDDLKYYQQLLVAADKHLPRDEAVFTVALSGSKAETVKQEDRDKAMARLNLDGQQIVRLMLSKCMINQARSEATGDTEMRVGAKQQEIGNMSIQDLNNCPYQMTARAQSDSVITDINGNSSLVHIKSTTEMVDQTDRQVREDFLHYRTNLRSSSFAMVTTAKTDIAFGQDSLTMQAEVSGKGSMQYVLMDGDAVHGPVSIEMTINSATNKMSAQYLFDLQTARGALRIVMIGTESSQEVYVNGEKVNPADFPQFVQAVQPAIHDVPTLQALGKKILQ